MSALGQKQTCAPPKVMSALPPIATESRHAQTVMSPLAPKAGMCSATRHVCFGPKADISNFSVPSDGTSLNLALYQYKCIGCSPGRHPDTRRMGSASGTGSRDNVHDRYSYISVWRSEPPQTFERRDRHRVHLVFPHSLTEGVRRVRRRQTTYRYISWLTSHEFL